MKPAENDRPLRRRLQQALADSHENDRQFVRLEHFEELEDELTLEEILAPHTLDDLRPAAVLIPLRDTRQGANIILTLRSDELRAHAGQISFPGGAREAGDADLVVTALRESKEEIDLDPNEVEIVGFLDDYPTITGYRVTPVVGLVSADAGIEADGYEVSEVFELPLSRVLDEISYVRKTIERNGLQLPYLELEYEGYRVWGATAGMLWNLRAKLIDVD